MSSQAEVVGAFIMFVSIGVVSLVGVGGSMFRKWWGPWLLIVGPLFSVVGFHFLKGLDLGDLGSIARFVGMFYVPVFLVALGFLYLTRKPAIKH